MVKSGASEIEIYERTLLHVRDEAGVQEWEFTCECDHESCHETVFLTLDAFETLRDSGKPVLAGGHQVSQVARARRARGAARALRAQAEHQVRRAKKNLGFM